MTYPDPSATNLPPRRRETPEPEPVGPGPIAALGGFAAAIVLGMLAAAIVVRLLIVTGAV